MAGDWIKIEAATPGKPEIFSIAEQLGVSDNEVLGAMLRFWIWADQQSLNGNALSVTKTALDRITCVSGIADAMQKVGWLEEKDGGFAVPNFDRHNGQTAKARALTRKRVQSFRSNAPSVTDALPEKRREEKSIKPPCSPPTERLNKVINDQPFVDKLVALYPQLDVPRQFKSMAVWLEANPRKANKKNFRQFVAGWLKREADDAADRGSKPGINGKAQSNGTRREGQDDERGKMLDAIGETICA